MNVRQAISRRRFLAGSSAAAAFTIIPRHVLGAEGQPSANSKLNIAAVGVGGMGRHDIQRVASENVAAICDVDQRFATEVAQGFPEAKIYSDFREMLDTHSDLDAVMVATPDHNHAVVALAAMRKGMHVFCQKPLTHSVREALLMGKVAAETQVATQMGNQGQASEDARLICEHIWAGSIGAVREVHSWSNRRPDISPRGIARPADQPPVPPELNWDLWLGPAPVSPLSPQLPSVCLARLVGFWNGSARRHWLPQSVSRLQGTKIGMARKCRSLFDSLERAPEVQNETAPLASIVTFRFAATADHPEVMIRWYDGGMMPPIPKPLGDRNIFIDDGTLIVGEEGLLLGAQLLPETLGQKIGKPPQVLPRSPGHYEEWIRACKGGPAAGSNFVDHAAHLAAVVLMGNIAIRTQQKLDWDAEQLQFKNSDRANELLHPPYREGWKLDA